ncbi:DUF58 domain-containing protein [Paenibacillus aurantiacus]|uniref:DUF58 domain-containing protein n=1 Tax=Paenibacillus aurantiacus TaxID=1936118 RepID=A0ABV5KKH4_9BACL
MSGRKASKGAGGTAGAVTGDTMLASAGAGGSEAGLGMARWEDAAQAERTAERGREVPVRSRHAARLMMLAFAGAAGLAAEARGGALEWLVFAAAAAASVIAWIVPYLATGRVEAVRSVEADRLEDGGDMTVRLTIRTSRPMPLMWVAVREEIRNVSASGESAMEANFVYMPWFRRSRTLTYTVSSLRRGELAFGRPTVACGDLLGMTTRTFYPAGESRVTIRPRPPRGETPYPLGGALHGSVEDGGKGALPTGAAAWQRDGRVRLQPGANPQTRIYRPGDPLRLVSWRAMARGLGMQTRVASPDPPGEIALLLDISAASYAGSDRQFDAAVGRAAAAMREAVVAGRSATLLAGSRRWRVRAGDGAALLAAEEELGRLRASGEIRLGEWLPAALAGLPRGADVVCVTADPRSIRPEPHLSGRAGRAARRAARAGFAGHVGATQGTAGSEAIARIAADFKEQANAAAQPADGSNAAGIGVEARIADRHLKATGMTDAKTGSDRMSAHGHDRRQDRSAGDEGRKAGRRRGAIVETEALEGMERLAASAKWVQSRGGLFRLWLGIGGVEGQSGMPQLRAWGTGMEVLPLPLTASYMIEPAVRAESTEGGTRYGQS